MENQPGQVPPNVPMATPSQTPQEIPPSSPKWGVTILIAIVSSLVTALIVGGSVYTWMQKDTEMATEASPAPTVVSHDPGKRNAEIKEQYGSRDILFAVEEYERITENILVITFSLTAGESCIESAPCNTQSVLGYVSDYKLSTSEGVLQQLGDSGAFFLKYKPSVQDIVAGDKVLRQIYFTVDPEEEDFVFKYVGGVYQADESYPINAPLPSPSPSPSPSV